MTQTAVVSRHLVFDGVNEAIYFRARWTREDVREDVAAEVKKSLKLT